MALHVIGSSVIGVGAIGTSYFLTHRSVWWGSWIGLLGQPISIAYNVTTDQPGFVLLALSLCVVYVKAIWKCHRTNYTNSSR